MLHKAQLDILLSALLVLLVGFCKDLEEHALDFESRALPARNSTTSDLTDEDQSK